MDLAWEFFDRDLFPEYAFVLADSQTRGRGQFGREWVSAPGNLFVTLRLPDSARALDHLLPLALALVVAKALDRLHVSVRIKWPNDLMTGDAKAGGILIEHKGTVIMAGLGLNICSAPENSLLEFFFHIKSGCLKNSGVNLEPSEIWTLILEQIKCGLPGMIASPATVVEDVQKQLAFIKETVVLENTVDNDGPARILGIDLHGRLIIETTKGVKSINRGRIYPRVV